MTNQVTYTISFVDEDTIVYLNSYAELKEKNVNGKHLAHYLVHKVQSLRSSLDSGKVFMCICGLFSSLDQGYGELAGKTSSSKTFEDMLQR